MSYFRDVEAWLDSLLASLPSPKREGAKRAIKAKLLESYRNGQAAATRERNEAPHEGSTGEPPAAPRAGSAADPVAYAKFFTPDACFTWYATEGSPEGGDFLFFGYVEGLEDEWGYFLLSELEAVRGGLGLPVERDLWFEPAPVSRLRRSK